ncbi:F-box/LRR-repeat protein At4g14096-like isoform X2 [Henckelia pumila]|uniref:F-box/LRR-repeat protein At4g14096-like isoform X2 n=1 Tax=Henckelia pumila TaxID=405737 RepID=UPI003C6DD816
MEESVQMDSNAMRETIDNGEDFISNLPESIISQILSLLPTKDALRTCVLSKDWEYKWTSIDNIVIDDRKRFSLKTTRKKSVVYFVDRIFILSHTSRLKRFFLSFQQEYDASRIMTWISAALMRNVEDLGIVYDYGGVVVPRCLFDCIPLTKLKLQLPCVFRPVQNWFSNLKVLHLGKVEIQNDHATSNSHFIFNFPVLETLELRDCKWLKVRFLEVKAPALAELKVIHYSDLPEAIAQSNQGTPLLKFNMLKRLEISTKCNSEAFLEFLHSTPYLQWIKLNVWMWNDYDYDLVESTPSCIVSHIKEVEFRGFKGEKPHVHLADFLLKNATELRKMTGLSRKKSDERRAEKNFWARLKGLVRDFDFEIGCSMKNMADFFES